MGMTVTLIADDAAQTSYTLIDASSSPWKLTTANWGNAVWDVQYTGPRGTLGPKAAASTVGNRQVALGLRLLPASVDAGAGHQKDLNEIVALMHRAGGRIRVEHSNQSYRQYLVVTAGSAQMQDWTNRAEFAGRIDYAVTFLCDPFVHGDSMEIVDGFDTDTLTAGDWGTVPAGFTVSGGALQIATSTDAVLAHNAWGYRHGDAQVEATFTWDTVTNQWVGVVLKYIDANNYLYAGVYDDGGTSTLYIGATISGSDNTLNSTALGSRVTASQPFRIVARVEGNRLFGEYYALSGNAEFRSSGSSTVAVLTGTSRTLFGKSVTGRCGITASAVALEVVDNFRVIPYTYASVSSAGVRELCGAIPGDAHALIDTEVLIGDGSATPRFGAVAATNVATRNYLDNGDFESSTVGSAAQRPWKVSAETGVTGAATSITIRSTASKYGSRCAEVVCPATANTGASSSVYGPFYAGRTYTFKAWVRAASGSTNLRLRLGVNGDIGSATASALSSTWTERTVTWTPSFDYLVAYAALEITAATATTFQFDAARVIEDEPSLPSQQSGRGGAPPVGLLLPDTAYAITTPTAVSPTSVAASWPYLTALTLRADTAVASYLAGYWRVDPNLVASDPHTGSVSVEVWAYIITPGTLTNGYARAAVGGYVFNYTQEYGSTGLSLGTSSSNLYRLGTLNLPANRDSRQFVFVQTYWTGGTGNIEIAWVLLMPSRRRWAYPTGKSTTGYPNLGYASGAMVKRLGYDGRGLAKTASDFGFYEAGGHGHVFTIDPGAPMTSWAFTSAVPSTTASAATAQAPSRLSFIPTPRWHQLRDE